MIDLSQYSETWLLEAVQEILAAPGEVTDRQRSELQAINQELERREWLSEHCGKAEDYATRRRRQRLRQAIDTSKATSTDTSRGGL